MVKSYVLNVPRGFWLWGIGTKVSKNSSQFLGSRNCGFFLNGQFQQLNAKLRVVNPSAMVVVQGTDYNVRLVLFCERQRALISSGNFQRLWSGLLLILQKFRWLWLLLLQLRLRLRLRLWLCFWFWFWLRLLWSDFVAFPLSTAFPIMAKWRPHNHWIFLRISFTLLCQVFKMVSRLSTDM